MSAVSVGRRANVGSFSATWTVPFGLVAAGAVLVVIRPMPSSVTLAGLVLDVFGAVTLVSGVFITSATRVRIWQTESDAAIGKMPWWPRSLVSVARMTARALISPNPVVAASASDVEDLTDAVWGLVLLALGFVGQAVGVALQLPWLVTIDGGPL